MGKKRLTKRALWSEDETDLLLQLRAEGFTITACAQRIGRSYHSCEGRLQVLRKEEKSFNKKEILERVSEIYKLAASKAWRLE